jgi:hypothetical protein
LTLLASRPLASGSADTPDRTDGLAMTKASDSNPRQFLIHGLISDWDSHTRQLLIAGLVC